MINFLGYESNANDGPWQKLAKSFDTKYNLATGTSTAIGSPNINMWIDSYNAKFGTHFGYKELEDGTYKVNEDVLSTPDNWRDKLSSEYMKKQGGYGSTTWYSTGEHVVNLTSKHVASDNYATMLYDINSDGTIGATETSDADFRPIVKIPISCIK